jgi:hypothetical protein
LTVTDEIEIRLPRRDKLLFASRIHAELIKGTDESEIADLLGLDRQTYLFVRSFMLQELANEIRSLSSDQQFVDYRLSQQRNIHDLDELIKNLDEQTQYNALVGALRLRSEIQDKIVTRGQEFGVISKQPDRKEIVAGVVVSDLSTADLREMITGQLSALHGMIEKHGDADIRALEPGELHRGENVELPKRTQRQRKQTASGKRSAVRRPGRAKAGRPT